jgi:hypothetical protein
MHEHFGTSMRSSRAWLDAEKAEIVAIPIYGELRVVLVLFPKIWYSGTQGVGDWTAVEAVICFV